jgi:putative oxidoreductase
MQRLFTVFPSGRPGAGLLVLRIIIGLAVMVHSVSGLSSGMSTWWRTGLDLAGVAGGLLVLAGFLTPWAAVWVASVVAITLFASPLTDLRGLSALLLLSDCAVLALVGPGAWSVDARLFGRREIVIPRS